MFSRKRKNPLAASASGFGKVNRLSRSDHFRSPGSPTDTHGAATTRAHAHRVRQAAVHEGIDPNSLLTVMSTKPVSGGTTLQLEYRATIPFRNRCEAQEKDAN